MGAFPSRRLSIARARSRGQAIVEFGLIALILVFTIGAGVDLGLMVATRQAVSFAAGEAARQAAYGATVDNVILAARQATAGSLARPSGLAVSVTYGDCTNSCTIYCEGFVKNLYGNGGYKDPA